MSVARHGRRAVALALGLVAGSACAPAGVLRPTPVAVVLKSTPCATSGPSPLHGCAPVVLQELHPGTASALLDRPTAFDPDASGRLVDDLSAWRQRPSQSPVPFYAAQTEDGARLYLFYGLYYPADWSGAPDRPRIDHRGDVEGALVVVSKATGVVEAVVTQAHKLLYLWTTDDRGLTRATSGIVRLDEAGRPVLFAESGGHGQYAFGRGAWRPRGGKRYADGPEAVPLARILRIALAPARGPDGGERVEAVLASLEELRRFPDLPPPASPPWLWQDRRGVGNRGAIVRDPGALYRALGGVPRP